MNITTKLSLLFLLLTLYSGCKKDEITDHPKQEIEKPNDQQASAEIDIALDNVNDIIHKLQNGANARISAYDLPCGVVRIDSVIVDGNKVYSLNYGVKTKCGYKYKSGLISFHLIKGNTFSEAGSVNKIKFSNYVIEGNNTGNIITLNGWISVTNVTGGKTAEVVLTGKTIQHRIRGKISATHYDLQTRERNLYKLRTYSNSSSGWAGLTATVAADTIIDNKNIAETGKTYDGNYDFMTEIPVSFLWSNCGSTYAGPYVLQTGEAKLHLLVTGMVAYIEVKAGYQWSSAVSTPLSEAKCAANAYKITTFVNNKESSVFQLY